MKSNKILIIIIIFIIKNYYCQETIIILPDSQYETAWWKQLFQEEISWILHCKNLLEPIFVSHVGDIVEHGSLIKEEWLIAWETLNLLNYYNIPWGVTSGNHDSQGKNNSLELFEKYFPNQNFELKKFYLNYGKKESYFLHIPYFYDIKKYQIEKLNNIFNNSKDNDIFITSHYVINDNYNKNNNTKTTYILPYFSNLLKNNCNIKMIFSGHIFKNGGENTLLFKNGCGKKIPIFLSNYQSRKKGGNGWLRFYQFINNDNNSNINKLCIYTFSPVLQKFEKDYNSWFSYNFNNEKLEEGCLLKKDLFLCNSGFAPGEFYISIFIILFIIFLLLIFLFDIKQ